MSSWPLIQIKVMFDRHLRWLNGLVPSLYVQLHPVQKIININWKICLTVSFFQAAVAAVVAERIYKNAQGSIPQRLMALPHLLADICWRGNS